MTAMQNLWDTRKPRPASTDIVIAGETVPAIFWNAAAKRGDAKRADLKGASKQMYDSMSEKQIDDFASTKRKGKPDYTPDSPIPAKNAARKRAAKKAAATRTKNAAKTKSSARKAAKKRARG